MKCSRLMKFLTTLICLSCFCSNASAYKRDYRAPISGTQRNVIASGSARYRAKFNEPGIKRYEELTVEVKHVPLPAGTVLVVSVENEWVGNLTIDNRQSGLLKVTSEERKHIPRIDPGTSLTITKLDGSIVIK